MKKHLLTKTLLALALVLVCGNAWADKITDYTNIVSGKQYYIGATTGGSDYYLSVDGSTASAETAISGTAVTAKGDAAKFTFEGSGTAWTIQFESGYYLSLKAGKANGKVLVVEDAATFTASNQSEKLRLTIGSYSIQKNNSGTQFGSYGNTQTDIWLEEASTSTPEVNFAVASKTIAVGGTYTQTATVSNAGTATATYTSSATSVATVDASTGEVTGVADGTATITATITVGGSNYTGSYTIKVVEVSDGVFDFTTGYDYGSGLTQYNTSVSTETTFTAGNITLTTSGSFAYYNQDGAFRVYSGGSYTLSAPADYVITEIAFTGTEYLTSVTVSPGDITGDGTAATWTGKSQTVTITRGGNNPRYNTITVTYEEKSNKETVNATISATSLTVGGTASITTVEGLAVTYSSDDTGVATVSGTGVVTGVAAGTATITAEWTEQTVDSKVYEAGSKDFNVTVYAVEDGIFDFTTKVLDYGSGISPTANGEYYDTAESTWTAGNVTMVVAGKYRWWNADGTLRLYNNSPASTITISVPSGSVITRIIVDGGSGLSATVGNYSSTTWTGSSQTVTLTYAKTSGSINMKSVTVTYDAIPVHVSSVGYATFYSDFDVTIPAGVKAFYAEAVDDGLVMHESADGKIKAGFGVVLEAAEDDYVFAKTTGATVDDSYNALTGVTCYTTKANLTGTYQYVLGMDDSTPKFFELATGGSLGANKAYFATDTKKSAIGMRWEGSTNIANVEAAKESNVYFDLMGRPVEQPTRGIYIMNGKKVFVK